MMMLDNFIYFKFLMKFQTYSRIPAPYINEISNIVGLYRFTKKDNGGFIYYGKETKALAE